MSNRFLLIAGTTALLGCDGDATSPQQTDAIRLAGTVTNAATEQPIEGAQVILQWSAGAFGTGTEWADTDAQGRYSLERDFGGARFTCDGFGITAQAEGYEPDFVQPGAIRCVTSVQAFDFALAPK
jgi:hypothetical protein